MPTKRGWAAVAAGLSLWIAARLIVTADAAMSGRGAEQVLAELLAEVPVPVRGEA